jgi:SAM-dependent methyltransferase
MIFEKYAKYYDLLYKDKDYKAESKYISSLIRKYKPGAKKILEFGSGSGIHGRMLSKLGYDIFGIERSQEMIDLGYQNYPIRNKDENFFISQGDCTKTFIANDFDAVISLFHVFSYQTSEKLAVNMLKNANRQLKKGGIFIYDYWFAPAVWKYRPTIRVKKVENSKLKITRIAEPICFEEKNLVDVNYLTFVEELQDGKISKIQETHKLKAFDLDDILQLSKLTGFEILHSEEWMSQLPPSQKTWGVCSILRKT